MNFEGNLRLPLRSRLIFSFFAILLFRMVTVSIIVVLAARGEEVNPGKQCRPDCKHHWYHPEKLLDVRDNRIVAKGCIQADLFGRDPGEVEPAGTTHLFFAVDMIVITIRCCPDPFVTQFDQIITETECKRFPGTYLY